ncbi:MAG: hypothetical protein WBP64_00250 [Nitrososphaeraceae archaeon]
MKLEKFMLMLSFGLIIFSIVSITAASAQPATPSVKITSPTKGQKLSDGIKILTITGTSSDRPDTKCTVGVLINDFKPYKNVIPSGTGKGAEDFSSWKYTFTPSNTSVIKEGNNRVTSKISCVNAKDSNAPAAQSVKFYSVNFTGVSNSYKPIVPSKSVNFAEMKKSKNVTPVPTVTSVNNGIKEHKKIVETAVNKTVNNGIAERKNSIVERKNSIENAVNVTNQGSASEKGTVFVPPYNIRITSGTINSNNSPNAANNQTTTNTTNIIPGKVVISNQIPAKPNTTLIPPKPTSSNSVSNHVTTNTTNIIPGRVVISKQSTTEPPPKPASIPPKPTITISINNSNSSATDQNPTSANTPSNNANNSSNSTTSTIINEQNQGQNGSIPGSVPNGIGPSLIFPMPFHELESTNLPSQPSPLQPNPSNSKANLGVQTSSGSPPIVAIKQSTSVVNGQEQVTFNGGASRSPSGSIVSYSWVPLSNSPSIISKGSDSPVLSFMVPKVQSDTHFAYRLTVTDKAGRASSATVDVLAKKTNPSASTSSINQLSSNSITQTNSNSHVQVSNSNQNVNVSTAIEQSQNIPSKFLVNNNQVNIPSPYTAGQINSSIVNIPSNSFNNNIHTTISQELASNLTANQSNLAPPLTPPFTSATTLSEKTIANKEPPVAVAGPDQIANGGSTVVVDGSGSYDPAGGDLSYNWDQIAGPSGTTVSGADTSGWSFKLPDVSNDALLKLKLTVTNNEGLSSTDYLNILDRSTNQLKETNNHSSDHHN